MDYKRIIENCDSSKYLISMTPVDKIIELGYYANLSKDTSVLDLCCGYGEMLRLWGEAFGITGKGVDICKEFIDIGKSRMNTSKLVTKITLVEEDVLKQTKSMKYDVVSMIGENIFGSFCETILELEKFKVQNGKIIIGTPYYNCDKAPDELIEFEGQLLTLTEIISTVAELGYVITHMVGLTNNEWERYISWSARRDYEWLKTNPTDENCDNKLSWIEDWYKMYANYRRKYEEWGIFILDKI